MIPYVDKSTLGPMPLKNDLGPSLIAMSLTTFQMTLDEDGFFYSLYRARRVLTTQNGVVRIIETILARREMITVVIEFGLFAS